MGNIYIYTYLPTYNRGSTWHIFIVTGHMELETTTKRFRTKTKMKRTNWYFYIYIFIFQYFFIYQPYSFCYRQPSPFFGSPCLSCCFYAPATAKHRGSWTAAARMRSGSCRADHDRTSRICTSPSTTGTVRDGRWGLGRWDFTVAMGVTNGYHIFQLLVVKIQ